MPASFAHDAVHESLRRWRRRETTVTPSTCTTRRSQKASDVRAEKEKVRPFEKARADLVKRNDKLDRDQVRGAASSRDHVVSRRCPCHAGRQGTGDDQGPGGPEEAQEAPREGQGGPWPASLRLRVDRGRVASRHRRDATRSSLDHTLSEHRPAPTSRKKFLKGKTS